MSTRHANTVYVDFDPLRRRCIRLAKTGQYRKAAIALAELARREQDAATWVRLGVMLERAGRLPSAVDALEQGLWLLRRHRDHRRAAVVSSLLERTKQRRAA